MNRGKMLIIGASGGIGRSLQVAAGKRGWECVGTSRKEGSCEFTLDCADREGLDPALMRLFTAEGPFAAVVYCAGVCPVKPLSMMDVSAMAEVQMVNCDAFVLAVKHFSRPGAFARGGAVALAISSISAREGWPGGTAYCASKGALSAASRALDAELSPKGIRVVAIEPGHVLTDMFRKGAGRMGVPESSAMSPETLAAEILDMIESIQEEKPRNR